MKIITCFICLFFISVTSVFSYGQYQEYKQLKQAETEIQEKIAKEKEKQALLLLEKEYNLTDSYVEKIAREKLRLVKSDEIIFLEEEVN